MALTKVIGNGLGTLGDGTANDTKIVFDGNGFDYHIGLDDSANTLVIGKGSALGTTTSMSFDSNGVVTKPLQPSFGVKPASNQNNLANHDVLAFGSEVFDNNGDFASNTFTAPVTGRYQFQFTARIDEIDTATNWCRVEMVTSNRYHQATIIDPDGLDSDPDYWSWNFSVCTDMDAGDTCYLQWGQSGGANQARCDTDSYFSGFLVC